MGLEDSRNLLSARYKLITPLTSFHSFMELEVKTEPTRKRRRITKPRKPLARTTLIKKLRKDRKETISRLKDIERNLRSLGVQVQSLT